MKRQRKKALTLIVEPQIESAIRAIAYNAYNKHMKISNLLVPRLLPEIVNIIRENVDQLTMPEAEQK